MARPALKEGCFLCLCFTELRAGGRGGLMIRGEELITKKEGSVSVPMFHRELKAGGRMLMIRADH